MQFRHDIPVAFLFALALVLAGCGGTTSVTEPAEQEGAALSSEEPRGKVESATLTFDAEPDENSELDEDAESDEDTALALEDEVVPLDPTEAALNEFTQNKRVGEVGIGFCDIPNYYASFGDGEGADVLQYANPTGTDIVTLKVIDASSVSSDGTLPFTAEQAAKNLWARLESEGATDTKGSHVSLSGHEAYQVYGTYPNGTLVIMWVTADYRGTIRFVSVESPQLENVVEMAALVESSYGFDR